MKYVVLVPVVLLALYLVGHLAQLALGWSIANTNQRVFSKLFLGVVALVTAYSIVRTSGVTINVGLIFLFFLHWHAQRHRDPNPLRLRPQAAGLLIGADLRALVTSLPFALGLALWQYCFIVQTSSLIPVIPQFDNRFLVDLAMFLNVSGKETLTWDYLNIKSLGTSPYHYFEAWFLAALAFLTQQRYWELLQLVVLPTLQSIVLIGAWAVFEEQQLCRIARVFSIVLVFMSGFYFSQLAERFVLMTYPYLWFYRFNMLDEPWALKMVVAYMFFIASLLLYMRDQPLASLLVLLAMPIVSINLAPVLLVTTSLITLYGSANLSSRRRSFHWVFYPPMVFLFILGFYRLSGSLQVVTFPSVRTIMDDAGALVASVDRRELIMFAEKGVAAILLYSPYLLLIGILLVACRGRIRMTLGRGVQVGLVVWAVILVSAGLLWILLRNTYGAHEFFFNPVLPATNLLLVLALHRLLFASPVSRNVRLAVGISLVMASSLLCWRSYLAMSAAKGEHERAYSDEFLRKVLAHREPGPVLVAKCQPTEQFYRRPVLFNPYLNLDATYLNAVFREFSVVNLSFSGIELTRVKDEFNRRLVLSSPFLSFLEGRKHRGELTSESEERLAFIVKHGIRYVVCTKGCPVDSLLKRYARELITDPISGDSFVVLDPTRTALRDDDLRRR